MKREDKPKFKREPILHPDGTEATPAELHAIANGLEFTIMRTFPCASCGGSHNFAGPCPNPELHQGVMGHAGALPKDVAERKATPIATGFIDYFPDAVAAVAQCSKTGNDQHHPDEPLHWDRAKSADESDALMRHFVERGKIDSDGISHTVKVAWRAMALLQKEIEERKNNENKTDHDNK